MLPLVGLKFEDENCFQINFKCRETYTTAINFIEFLQAVSKKLKENIERETAV